MAGKASVCGVTDNLVQMSLQDFLQEEPKLESGEKKTAMPKYPTSPCNYPTAPRARRGGRWRGRGGRTEERAPPPRVQGWRGAEVQPRVLLTQEPRPVRRMGREPRSQPSQSLLKLGGQHLPSAKKGGAAEARRGAQEDLGALLNGDASQQLTFVLGEPVHLPQGLQHHFLSLPHPTQLRRDSLLKEVVGLLNTGRRGVVVVGVGPGGVVQGVSCSPQTVVQLAHGLMNTCQYYLVPRHHPPQYGVRYTNVETTAGHTINNLWVIELHLLPSPERYYSAVQDPRYHLHHEGRTLTLSFPDFCSSIVAHASRRYLEEEEQLQQEVKALEEALEGAGVDSGSVEPHVCPRCWFCDCPVQCYGRPAVAK